MPGKPALHASVSCTSAVHASSSASLECVLLHPAKMCSPKPSALAQLSRPPFDCMHSFAMYAVTHEADGSVLWSAKVGNTSPEEDGGKTQGSSRTGTDTSAGFKQAVLLVPVNMTASAGDCVQHVIGAWLQSILRKYVHSMDTVHLHVLYGQAVTEVSVPNVKSEALSCIEVIVMSVLR